MLPIPAALAEGPTAPDNIHLSTLAAKQRANAERKEQRGPQEQMRQRLQLTEAEFSAD